MVHTIRGAFRDLNCKGKGPETFRKVWRDGTWRWISPPLPAGAFRASDRRADTRGDVETGEIVAEFGRQLPERRCAVYGFWVVQDAEKPLHRVEYTKPALGIYRVAIADRELDLPDPMARA